MLAASKKDVTVEETMIQQQEREFYKKLSKPLEEADGLVFLVRKHKDEVHQETKEVETELDDIGIGDPSEIVDHEAPESLSSQQNQSINETTKKRGKKDTSRQTKRIRSK